MSILRSERNSASLLLLAAILGLILANSQAGEGLISANHEPLGWAAIGLEMSVGHWISDGLLAIFFFIIAVELKHELVAGSLNNVKKAVVPAIAALGGVVVPAGIYLLGNAGSSHLGGWPIPTATDIAFALGVLAIFGRALPSRIRTFLLALAVLDDVIAILIIAVFFTDSLNLLWLGAATVGILVFGWLSRIHARASSTKHVLLGGALVVVAVLSWYFTYQSGIHPTIAGVALGLVMTRTTAARTAHALQPWSNGVILPLFAFSAALVLIPSAGIADLSTAFWGILIALPIGKLVGITLAGWLGSRVTGRSSSSGLRSADLVTVAALGGIGFTVSLLMNELAFTGNPKIADEGTLAVLLGSVISIVLATILLIARSRRYRQTSGSGGSDAR